MSHTKIITENIASVFFIKKRMQKNVSKRILKTRCMT
nr:MAG TPA: hypothetical protein [Caudoviricetes sp.]